MAGQNPVAGTRAPPGSTVAVALTTAAPPPRLAIMPNLIGLPVAQATTELQNAGLVLGPIRSGTGRISGQTPAAGTLLPPGSTVTVRLAADATPTWSPTPVQSTAAVALLMLLALLAIVVGAARARPRRPRDRPRARVRVDPAGAPRLTNVAVRRADHSPPTHAIRLEPRFGRKTVTMQEVHHGQR